jgi:hypothetical protein
MGANSSTFTIYADADARSSLPIELFKLYSKFD